MTLRYAHPRTESPAPTDAPRRIHAYKLAIVVIVLAGMGCRLAQYLARPSYWHDEALVALNVMDKTAGQLLGKLEYAQAAPPLFLMAERAMYLAFGSSEYALRAVSLVCGLLSLVLFSALCGRVLPLGIVPWVVAFFAFSDKLIWHSAEVKPYVCDAMVAVILLTIALARRDEREQGREHGETHPRRSNARAAHSVGSSAPDSELPDGARPGVSTPTQRLLLLSLFATFALWFSFPSAIVFGGLSLMLLPQFLRRGIRGLLVYFLCNALVGVSFLLLFHFSVKPQHVDYLSSYWVADFPNYSRPLTIPLWLAGELYSLCNHPYRSFGAIILPLAILGIVGWSRLGRRDVVAACLLPVGLAILAAFLKQYPFNGDRLTVYLLPGLFLLCGGGLVLLRDLCHRAPPGALRVAWIVPTLVIAGRGAGEAAWRVAVPRSRSGVRPAVEYVKQRRAPGEGLYLVGEPEEHTNSYATKVSLETLCYWHVPPQPWHAGMPPDLATIPEEKFWVILATLPRHGTAPLNGLTKQLAPYATEQDRYLTPRGGGAAVLFVRRPSDASK